MLMRLKSTGEIVIAINQRDKWIDCLFRHKRVTKKGNLSVTQPVRREKLEPIKIGYSYG